MTTVGPPPTDRHVRQQPCRGVDRASARERYRHLLLSDLHLVDPGQEASSSAEDLRSPPDDVAGSPRFAETACSCRSEVSSTPANHDRLSEMASKRSYTPIYQ